MGNWFRRQDLACLDKRKDQLVLQVFLCLCSVCTHIFHTSNMIYLLPVTCLMWLSIGSHSAISRQVQYYLSELIWAGIKRLPMANQEQNHTAIQSNLLLFPIEVLHLYLVLTHNCYQDTVHSQLSSQGILPVEVSQQWPCGCGSWARL